MRDYNIKITDFGLSLFYDTETVCRSFKGNVKYSAPEILQARFTKSVNVYAYGPKTDIYAYGLMLWEIVSQEDLFPDIKSKDALATYVIDGNRPPLLQHWPQSFVKLLCSLWDGVQAKRPLFPEILEQYDDVVIDLLCSDVDGRRVIKRVWKGNMNEKVAYPKFEEVLFDIVGPHAKIKPIHLSCFQKLLCIFI